MLKTRYIDISKEIETGITSGKWKGKLPGVVRLGKILGADPATISKALKILAGNGIVTIERNKGTFISKNNLHRAKHNTIAIIGFAHIGEHSSELAKMRGIITDKGYKMIVVGYDKVDSSSVCNIPADGFIFCNSILTPEIILNLRKMGIPFVSMNRISETPGVNWVDFDNERGIENALAYLNSIGHRRIAYINYRYSLEEHERRIYGVYKRVMESKGIFDRKLYVSSDEGYNGIIRKIRYLMSLKNSPTAAYISSVQITRRISEELKKKGINIPGDFSIISGVEIPETIKTEKFFTLLTCMSKKRAEMTTQILINLIDNLNNSVVQELLPRKLILQKSTSTTTKKG